MKRFIANIPGIGPNLLLPVKNPNALPSWLPTGAILTPNGTNALYLGYRVMGIKRGDQVLIPSFSCYSIAKPLQKLGARPMFFNVFKDGSIDWDHVKRLMNNKVKAFVWYHYLGLSCGFDEVIAFCRERGIYLVEDCAHALFSTYRNRPAGWAGDFSMFSFRKCIPTFAAGALVLNNKRFRLKKSFLKGKINKGVMAFNLEKENYLYRLHLQSINPCSYIKRRPYQYYADFLDRVYADETFYHLPDETTFLIVHNIVPEKVQAVRHRNFRIYLKYLKEIGLFKDIATGASPIGFPVLVKNRDRFQKRLEREGVETLIHWSVPLLPKGVAKKFKAAQYLASSILSLPCHYDLSPEDIEYICYAVKKLI